MSTDKGWKGSLPVILINYFYLGISTYFNSYPYIPSPRKNNNEEHLYILTNDNRHIPNEKLMTIDMLNINSSLVEAEISNSYCDRNGRHGCIANVPHLLDLYRNRLPGAGKASAPGNR